jgi:uncharacterized protein YyaL (SSP411 family)
MGRAAGRPGGLALCMLALTLVPRAGWTNALAGHPSPYLAMHGDDPVAWHTWGRETVEEARREGKLLFVSSGYFACHWCHVMQAESYRDPEVAAFLNRYFVPVKVDRELQPALDAYLIDFVERTVGVAGWPLNVFLTPEGHPLVGTTYLPRDRFLDYLRRLHETWEQDREDLARLAGEAAGELASERRPAGRPLGPEGVLRYREALVDEALGLGDELEGGFGHAAKFPATPQLAALLDEQARRPNPRLAQFLRLTLHHMASRGLRDHIGGGFYRYTVDPNWQVPHFEKMLYDNGQLARVFARAARVLDEPVYGAIAEETLEFMLRELRGEGGAFIASLSALDGRGVEGGYYLWDSESLESALSGEELTVARLAWGLEGPAPFDAGHLPMAVMTAGEVAAATRLPPPQVERLLASARERLFIERAGRTLPRDTKRLAAWNGLALMALAEAAKGSGDSTRLRQARQVRDYLATRLWDGKSLKRADDAGKAMGEASLEDYAYTAAGLLAWAEPEGGPSDYELARRLVEEAWRRFHSADGWSLAEAPLIPAGAAEPLLADGPMPSPSAVLLRVSLRLAERLGDDTLRRRSLEVLAQDHARLAEDPFANATHINLLADYASAIGADEEPAPQR